MKVWLHLTMVGKGAKKKATKVTTTMVKLGNLKPNRKLFPDHLSFILHGALTGGVLGSLGGGALYTTMYHIM